MGNTYDYRQNSGGGSTTPPGEPGNLPAGGNPGQVLTVVSSGNYQWRALPGINKATLFGSGRNGQVYAIKPDGTFGWVSLPVPDAELPTGGSAGQYLSLDVDGNVIWVTPSTSSSGGEDSAAAAESSANEAESSANEASDSASEAAGSATKAESSASEAAGSAIMASLSADRAESAAQTTGTPGASNISKEQLKSLQDKTSEISDTFNFESFTGEGYAVGLMPQTAAASTITQDGYYVNQYNAGDYFLVFKTPTNVDISIIEIKLAAASEGTVLHTSDGGSLTEITTTDESSKYFRNGTNIIRITAALTGTGAIEKQIFKRRLRTSYSGDISNAIGERILANLPAARDGEGNLIYGFESEAQRSSVINKVAQLIIDTNEIPNQTTPTDEFLLYSDITTIADLQSPEVPNTDSFRITRQIKQIAVEADYYRLHPNIYLTINGAGDIYELGTNVVRQFHYDPNGKTYFLIRLGSTISAPRRINFFYITEEHVLQIIDQIGSLNGILDGWAQFLGAQQKQALELITVSESDGTEYANHNRYDIAFSSILTGTDPSSVGAIALRTFTLTGNKVIFGISGDSQAPVPTNALEIGANPILIKQGDYYLARQYFPEATRSETETKAIQSHSGATSTNFIIHPGGVPNAPYVGDAFSFTNNLPTSATGSQTVDVLVVVHDNNQTPFHTENIPIALGDRTGVTRRITVLNSVTRGITLNVRVHYTSSGAIEVTQDVDLAASIPPSQTETGLEMRVSGTWTNVVTSTVPARTRDVTFGSNANLPHGQVFGLELDGNNRLVLYNGSTSVATGVSGLTTLVDQMATFRYADILNPVNVTGNITPEVIKGLNPFWDRVDLGLRDRTVAHHQLINFAAQLTALDGAGKKFTVKSSEGFVIDHILRFTDAVVTVAAGAPFTISNEKLDGKNRMSMHWSIDSNNNSTSKITHYEVPLSVLDGVTDGVYIRHQNGAGVLRLLKQDTGLRIELAAGAAFIFSLQLTN